jgi:hypothetical protein
MKKCTVEKPIVQPKKYILAGRMNYVFAHALENYCVVLLTNK